MKFQGIMTAMMIAAAALVASSRDAAASVVLYDNVGFVRGQQSFSQSFDLGGPGTLTVTLSNIAWPQSLSSLNLVVSTPSGLLGPEMGAGTDIFKIGGPETVYTQWFGVAQGSLDVGVYGVKVNWSPTAVPLPASIAFLLSGLALLDWHRRSRRQPFSAGMAESRANM